MMTTNEGLYTPVEAMKKRKLTYAEKRVITFLDSTVTRERSGYYVTHIEESPDGDLNLTHGKQTLACHANTLLSLVGKGLIKIKYDRVELDLVIYRRSIPALKRDGYFEDVE